MSRKLSDDVKLRRMIRRTIESRVNFLNKPERENYREIVGAFLERYILCEVGTRKALNSYYKNKGEEKEAEDVNMPVVHIESALKEAGFDTNTMALDKMFKKNNKRGNKSARDLRNAIVHDYSVNDIQELVSRWDELQSLLDSYIACLTFEPLD